MQQKTVSFSGSDVDDIPKVNENKLTFTKSKGLLPGVNFEFNCDELKQHI